MATIPIEVIIQDETSPVEPTPTSTPTDPSDPRENTNITVPETGAGIADSNNGNSMSSPATIIVSIVIAILAIGTVIALLIRKYNKRKISESGMTRQEKRAMVATGTIAVLATTVLLGQLVVAGVVSPIATNAATDNTTNDEAELDVDSKITIIATRTEDEDTVVTTVKNTSTITVDKPFGYEVAVSMTGDNTNLYLNGDETSEYYLSPVEGDALTDNTWGYTLDEKEYNAVPPVNDLSTIAKGTTPVADEEINVYYGIKVDKDLPAGTYTGELEYILSDTGFSAALRTMQDMTTDICDSAPTPEPFKADGATIEDNVPTVMLKDIRDNKTYTVAKLADGKCWMTQNLDLQKENLVVASLDNTNTDNPADGFELPDSQTIGGESWGENTAHIYDLASDGQDYYYCSEYYPWSGGCGVYSDEKIPKTELGNYYNWFAATAGTSIEVADRSGVAAGSICPIGWRLPAEDYVDLMRYYGLDNASFNVLKVFSAPMKIMRAGYYGNGVVASIGGLAEIWNSRRAYSNYVQTSEFYVYETGLYPRATSRLITNGVSVRCLAR